MKFILKWEGGYIDDPHDTGGETKYGISKKCYPDIDIPSLTIDEAKEIYYRDYWLKAGCDEYYYPYNIITFDTAVNCGVVTAKRLWNISDDWKDYLLNRIDYYTRLNGAKYYLKGWTNRVMDLYQFIKERR